jgi:hypothetical protein
VYSGHGITARFGEAEKLLRETLDLQRRVLGSDNRDAVILAYNVGCMSALRGDRDGALSSFCPPQPIFGIERIPIKSLHSDPRFVAHAKERAAGMRKTK